MHAACTNILTLAPQHADAHFLTGVAHASTGRFAEALGPIGRALELAPERADYHAQHARCLLMLRRHAAAVAAAERVLELEPRDALALDTAGVVFSRAGAHERAAEALRRAAMLRPDRADFLYNLAAALRILGDFSGAEEALERAVAVEPKLYKAYSMLAELRQGQGQGPGRHQIERLTALLDSVGDDVDGELHLRHALAKALEDLGEYEAAFTQLAAGKARKRAAVGYAFETDQALFDAVEAVCGPRLISRAEAGDPSEAPIFVVGMPRSGTTLVERILSSHTEVESAGELAAFSRCLKRLAGTRSRRVLDPETVAAAAEIDVGALGRCYREAARAVTGGKRRFVDKMPLNFFLVGFIAAALPNAKIVGVRRGALDTCVGNYLRLVATDFVYYHYTFDLLDIGRYYARFDALMRQWARLLGDRYYEIRYEALVADQRGETRRLLEHVGLDWQDACLGFERNAGPVATASAVQVREPLHTRHVGRWRRYAASLEPLRAELERAGIGAQ